MKQQKLRRLAIITAALLGITGVIGQVSYHTLESNAAKTNSTGKLVTVKSPDINCAPCGIAEGSKGTVILTDTFNNKIWKLKSNKSSTLAGKSGVKDIYGVPVGGYKDTSAKKSLFAEPWAVSPFLNGWAVTDTENSAVRLIRKNKVETLNVSTSSNSEKTTFSHPTGLATDNKGRLYVADTGNGSIRIITKDGDCSTLIKGLNRPTGLCWYNGTLYACETGKNRILQIKNGKSSVIAGSGSRGYKNGKTNKAAFSSPQGIVVDSDGSIYVSDTVNSAVRKIKNKKVETVIASDSKDLTSKLVSPVGLMIHKGDLYICDNFARQIYKYTLK